MYENLLSDLRELDQSQIITKLFSGYQADLSYLDTLMLWGPSLDDLNDPSVVSMLRSLQTDGFVRRIGINTHHANVMEFVIASSHCSIFDDLMVDYNLLQKSRAEILHKFVDNRPSRKVWSGTALCQGFLLQSLLSMYLRTRSLSYLARALLSPPTRIYLTKSVPLRRSLRSYFGSSWFKAPLSYVLNNSSVSYVPMGMLSSKSIANNVDIASYPLDQSQIISFLNSVSQDCFVDDVFP